MLRAVGALLLAGSGLALGLGAAGELAGQRRDLTDLAAALGAMEGELALCLPSTPALLERVSRRAEGNAAPFFRLCLEGMGQLRDRDFGEIWAAALSASPLRLPELRRQQMLALGKALGRYDGDQLLRCCRQTREELEAGAGQAAERLGSQGRVYGTLGLSLGLFAAILLL